MDRRGNWSVGHVRPRPRTPVTAGGRDLGLALGLGGLRLGQVVPDGLAGLVGPSFRWVSDAFSSLAQFPFIEIHTRLGLG